MKKFIRFSLKVALLLAISVFLWPSQAQAQCTFTNGDFETATLTGWTKYFRSQNAGDWFNYSGTASPLTTHTISAPLGTRGAVTDHNAPTTHELYQDIAIPAGQSTITFYMAYNNTNGFFVTLNTLDWVNNQQARIDIVKTTTPNESIATSDIISPLYKTRPGDPLVLSPMTQFFYDTSALAGQTVRLRFAEAVGLSYFPLAIDNVCLSGGLTTFSRNTPTGSRVTTNLGDVSVFYNSVTVAGTTSVQQLGTGTQSNPPVGETFAGPAYDISTTATVTAPMTVCVHTPPGTDRSHIRLAHKVAGIWVDVVSSTVNESLRAVCGDVTSLSPFALAINPALPTNAPSTISGTITTSDGASLAGATVSLDGTNRRKTITDNNGAYRFENVETNNLYMLAASRVNYTFSPASRSLSVLGNVSEASFSASRDSSGANEIDSPDVFVRQHYVDFLGREPDESGFNFWSDQILSCAGDTACTERRRINVSAAYFLSTEFQQTGGLVDALYRASYNRRPMYAEFMPDAATVGREVVVGRADWGLQLEANKEAFITAWVERPTFRAAYDNMANDAFVDALISHTSAGFNGDRSALISGLVNGTMTRKAVLRQVAENEGFARARSNQMFVMMEYFGYLRRDPDENGYQFWLNKLNQFNGNFEQAEMVKSFLVSGEYRARFQ